MSGLRIALVLAAVACGACTAGSEGAVVSRSGEPVIAQVAAGPAASPARPAAPVWSPAAVPGRSTEPGRSDGCPIVRADRLDRVVARAIDGLDDTTSADGWSRACAHVLVPGGSTDLRPVTVRIGWMGTVHEYASLPGAEPIDDLADEAYRLDDGELALREGELVAIVRWSGATASETVALARVVADQLRD